MRGLIPFSLLVLALNTSALAAGLPWDDALARQLQSHGSVIRQGSILLFFYPDSLSTREAEAFAVLSDLGIKDIATFTGVAAPSITRIYLSPEVEISHTYPRYPLANDHQPRVFLPLLRVKQQDAPYLHELTHAVMGDGGATWLEEGFASYVASEVSSRFGGYYAPVLTGGNGQVDEQARRALEERAVFNTELGSIRSSREPHFKNQEQRRIFYILSHSFTKFLVARMGIRQMTAIHRSANPSRIQDVTGLSIGELQLLWQHQIRNAITHQVRSK